MTDPYAALRGAFERAAPTYDIAGIEFFAPFGERLAEVAVLQPGERVLDVACGAGAVLLPAAELVGPDGVVVGVDAAPAMVARARAAAAERGLENVRVGEMDAQALGFEDASFDVVFCGFGVFFMPDPQAALREWHRVLAPHGRLGASVWSGARDPRWAFEGELIREFAHEVPAELVEGAARMTQQFNDARSLKAALRSGGFKHVAVEEMEIERSYADRDGWWDWNFAQGFRAFFEAMSEDAVERFRAAAYERMDDGTLPRRFVGLLATAHVQE